MTDNGIAINYSKENNVESYYFVGFDLTGKLFVRKVEGDKSTTLSTTDVECDTLNGVTLGIYKTKSKASIYVDNKYCTDFDFENNSANFGLLAGGKNTSYKLNSIVENQNYYLNSLENYSFANGSFKDNLVSVEGNSLALNKAQEFTSGTIQLTVNLAGIKSDSGIVFGLEDNGSSEFWEKGVSYYFYFVSIDGLAYLGKVANGAWQICSTSTLKGFNPSKDYDLKVIKKENVMYCFTDGELQFSYTDSRPLKGTKFGIRAGRKDVTFSSISINNRIIDSKPSEDLIIGHGEIENFEGIMTTSSEKNIALKKNGKLKDGTIKTTLLPGSSNDSGIIFRASAPEGEFYSNEEGLSYYWLYYTSTGTIGFSRFENGKEERLGGKFLPYGSLANKTYSVKIVMDGNDFYCYFDGRLSFHYHDETPLQGEGYGLKSEARNCMVLDFNTSDDHQKETNEYLIFGHSYTEYWSTYKDDLPYFEDINDIGIGASTTAHWVNQYADEVIAYEPRYGIYWNGINDISQGVAPANIATNIIDLLVKVKESLPEFEVVLLGTNRCPFAKNNRDKISQLNSLLKEKTAEYEFIHFVDTEFIYCDASGNELSSYFTDGLHPNHEGYLLAAGLIEAALGL